MRPMILWRCKFGVFLTILEPRIGETMLGNILVWIIVGAIAGWLASVVMRTNAGQGLLGDIIVGILGGLIGGFVLRAIGVGAGVSGINLPSVLVAFIGAVILLALLRVLRR
jgi:uncharacterized membrane protein YeaQ/YmgE (transglycosylase-associated protein family)